MLSIECLRPLLVQFVQDPALEELLVADSYFHGVVGGAPARHGRVDSLMIMKTASRWRDVVETPSSQS